MGVQLQGREYISITNYRIKHSLFLSASLTNSIHTLSQTQFLRLSIYVSIMSSDGSDNDNDQSRNTFGHNCQGKALGSIVVAVDSNHKASQYALKWAIDRLLYRETSPNRSITLLNVRHIISFNRPHPEHCSNNSTGSNFLEREPDDQEMETLSHFRGFCVRRQIQFEIVVVEDDDVAQALVDYVIRHRIENLLLGAPSRNGFSRLFKHSSAITSTVVKWIPNFCNVYLISRLGKPNNVRNAHHPVPSMPPLHHNQPPQPNNNNNDILAVSTRRRGGSLMSDGSVYDEIFEFSPFPSPEPSIGPATDTMFLSLYQSLDYRRRSLDDFRFLNECTATSLFLTQKLESMEKDIKRLKLDQSVGMYHKESLPPNEKLWKFDNITTHNSNNKKLAGSEQQN